MGRSEMHEQESATEDDRAVARTAPASPRPRRPVGEADRATLQVSLVAARGLLRAATVEEAAAVVASAVRELGGELEPPASRSGRQLPLDVSFGAADPLVPAGDPSTLELLRAALPAIVEDAHVALGRIRREGHLTAPAGTAAAPRGSTGCKRGWGGGQGTFPASR